MNEQIINKIIKNGARPVKICDKCKSKTYQFEDDFASPICSVCKSAENSLYGDFDDYSKFEDVAYRFFVFRHVLVALSEENSHLKSVTVTLNTLKEAIPNLKEQTIVGIMSNICRNCKGWCAPQLDPIDFSVMWRFTSPNPKQLADTVWELSSGGNCKPVKIELYYEINN